MNLQQLRYLRETVRCDLNLTTAAGVLHTSQPGLSKAIRELEDELGITIFVRHGKRLTQLTDPGRQVLAIAERILLEIDNLRHSAREFRNAEVGELRVAATHTQARYTLPPAIAAVRIRYPQVVCRLHQGNPSQIVQMLRAGTVDLGIATEGLGLHDDIESHELFGWYHCAVTTAAHPLCRFAQVTLEQLAEHDLITYDPEFAGRRHIDQAFADRRLQPRIVLQATDSDVIKTYARLGLGVGLVSELALFDPGQSGPLPLAPAAQDSAVLPVGDQLASGHSALATNLGRDTLVTLPIGRPFARNITRIGYLRGRILRGYEEALIGLMRR